MTGPPNDDEVRYSALLAHAKQLHESAASEDEILAAMRRAWPSPIQSIKVLRTIYGIPLAEAKRRLHASLVWTDQVADWEALHAQLEAAFAADEDTSRSG